MNIYFIFYWYSFLLSIKFLENIFLKNFHQYLWFFLQNVYFLYQRNGCFKLEIYFFPGKLSIQILKFSLIIKLIVQVTLTLTYQSIRLLLHTQSHSQHLQQKETLKKNRCLLMKETVKLNLLVNSIPSRFLKYSSKCWKEHLHTSLNIFRRFSACHKVSQCAKVGHMQDLFWVPTWFPLPCLKNPD